MQAVLAHHAKGDIPSRGGNERGSLWRVSRALRAFSSG